MNAIAGYGNWKDEFMNKIVVSVIMLAYNHDRFISQAIEGVRMQATDFSWELLIADDCSSDRTEEICRDYLGRDGRIKYIRNERNLGANANFINVYRRCTGDYIALCEGDDYWIDPYKLQKQIEFLRDNKAFAICFHDVYELKKEILNVNSITYKKDEFDILDLAKGNFIQTPSVVFINLGDKVIPPYFSTLYIGDYMLHMQVSKFGRIKLLKDKMAVYRIHDGGSWSTRNDEFVYLRISEYLERFIRDNFSAEVKEVFRTRLLGTYQSLFSITKKTKYLFRLAKIAPISSLKIFLKNVVHR